MSTPILHTSGNYAIRKLSDDPSHEFNQVPGCPGDWPVAVDYIGMASTSPWPNRTIISAGELFEHYTFLLDSFNAWHEGTWKPFIAQRAETDRAANATLEDELRQLLTNLRTAYTNWASLTPAQKDTAQRQSIRAIGLLFQLGKVT